MPYCYVLAVRIYTEKLFPQRVQAICAKDRSKEAKREWQSVSIYAT